MTKKTETKTDEQTPDQKTIAELTDQNTALMAQLDDLHTDRRNLLGAIEGQNLRLVTLERALAVASGTVTPPPLTVNLSHDAHG